MNRLAFSLLFLLPLPASAFVVAVENGFEDDPLYLNYNFSQCPQDSTEMAAVLADAISDWNDIPGSRLRVKLGVAVTKTETDYLAGDWVSAPTIVCSTTIAETGATNALAYTYQGSLGTRMVGSMIVLNVDLTTNAGPSVAAAAPTALRNLMVHEFGHTLGLMHTTASKAVMKSGGGAMSMDDWDGIRFLYPVQENLDTAFGCQAANASDLKHPKRGFPLDWLFLLTALIFGRWVFRKRITE